MSRVQGALVVALSLLLGAGCGTDPRAPSKGEEPGSGGNGGGGTGGAGGRTSPPRPVDGASPTMPPPPPPAQTDGSAPATPDAARIDGPAIDSPRGDAGTTPSPDTATPPPPPTDGPAPPPASTGIFGSLPEGGGVKSSPKAFEDRLYQVDIVVAPADWNRLQANAERYDTEGTYIPATVTIDGMALGQVGMRYKGAWGTFRRCLRGANGQTAGVVSATPISNCGNKLPMKLHFAEYDMMKRWNGLKKVNLHSLIADPAKLREKVTYMLYRAMGVVTARATHARVSLDVGGTKLTGVFGLVEHVTDGRFTEDHWPGDQNGNLYKQGWPTSTGADYWRSRLETNVDPPPPATTHDKVIAFAQEVNAAKADPKNVLAVLQKHTSVEHLARLLAVQTATKNSDSLARWYCPDQSLRGCFPNNYLLYQLTMQDRFLFVPWDVDDSLQEPSPYDVLPPWDEPPTCTRSYTLFGAPHVSPACDPILAAMALPDARKHYVDAMAALLAGPFEARALGAKIDAWAAAIRPAVAAGNRATINGITFDWTTSVGAWEGSVSQLKDTIRTLNGMTRNVVDGKKFRPWPR